MTGHGPFHTLAKGMDVIMEWGNLQLAWQDLSLGDVLSRIQTVQLRVV